MFRCNLNKVLVFMRKAFEMLYQTFLLLVFNVLFGYGLVQYEQALQQYLDDSSIKNVDPSILQDSILLAPDLIRKYGYPCEVHKIETEDGFILEAHRIARPGAQPVLLMHGLLDSSSTWVIMGPGKALGYILYDLGYDVWMGNVRGNRYSRKHKKYTPRQSQFWDFTFNEIGKYDLPAFIDYALARTKYKKLHYVGHSQGSATFWILCSERPEYNKKIFSMQAIGPISYLRHAKSPIVVLMSTFIGSFKAISKLIGMNEFLPSTELITIIGNLFCPDGKITQAICKNIIFSVVGYNKQQMNTTMLPVMLGHTPAGASSKQIVHFLQLKKSGRFRQYDYGMIKNKIKYGTFSPPSYELSRVKTKVALHYSLNDWMSDPRDVEKLHQQLPNPIGKFLVDDKNFNHLDFVWGINAKEYLYNRLTKIMKFVENGDM